MNLAHKLQNDLIHRIGQIDDVNFLKAIQSILDNSNKAVFELNEEQQSSISKSREELKNGEGLDHQDVIDGMRAWLQKK
ncbi:MAG: hypothetical protein KBF73_05580 [Flavobacteriales bacterium]|nr:hypothetical protein [Flavobacteriales bacterium]